MLGLPEIAVVALGVVAVALFLRLRQQEPAAVAQLGQRLAAAREELEATEARVAELRAELVAGDDVLEPLRAQRAALETTVAATAAEAERAEAALRQLRAELDAGAQELTEQRARRAEAEAALRAAQGARPEVAPQRDLRAERGLDLAAFARDARQEPAITTTEGAVRPTETLPPASPDGSDAAQAATKEQHR